MFSTIYMVHIHGSEGVDSEWSCSKMSGQFQDWNPLILRLRVTFEGPSTFWVLKNNINVTSLSGSILRKVELCVNKRRLINAHFSIIGTVEEIIEANFKFSKFGKLNFNYRFHFQVERQNRFSGTFSRTESQAVFDL